MPPRAGLSCLPAMLAIMALGGSPPRTVGAQAATPLRVDSLDVGALEVGDNTLVIRLANPDSVERNVRLSVQIRGLRGWGRTWHRHLAAGEVATMTVQYQVPDRSYRVLTASLATGPRMPSQQDPYPPFKSEWSRRYFIPVPPWVPAAAPWVASPGLRDSVRALERTGAGDAGGRGRLREVLGWDRPCAADFSPQVLQVDTIGPYVSTAMRIAGESGTPIEFSILRLAGSSRPQPTVLYLVGNPPGTRSAGLIPSMAFAQAGLQAVTMDRRPSARSTEAGEYLENIAGPVFDAARLVDYLLTRPDVDRQGIAVAGFSRGAYEAQFLAALHDSVKAAVLVAGVTSHERLFESVAWVPTLYDPLVLDDIGHPELVGQGYDVWANTLTVRDHAAARAAYKVRYPFFGDLDPVRVLSLAAPKPLLVITGALDEQFALSGVLQLDSVVTERYASLGAKDASALMIQPRTDHGYSADALDRSVAFLRYWFGVEPAQRGR